MSVQSRVLEAIDRLENNAESIFVREVVNGIWGSYALTKLPAPLAIAHVCRLIRTVAEMEPEEALRGLRNE